MARDAMIPIDIESWDQHDSAAFMFEGTMVEDFGPWKSGDKVSLWVDYEKGTIQSYNSEIEKVEHSVKIKLQIVE